MELKKKNFRSNGKFFIWVEFLDIPWEIINQLDYSWPTSAGQPPRRLTVRTTEDLCLEKLWPSCPISLEGNPAILLNLWRLVKLYFQGFYQVQGGQYCPPDFWQGLQQKLEEPVTWIFQTFRKYVYTLTSKKKNCNVNPDRLAERGVKSAGQDILCIFWTYLHFLWCIISISSCWVSKYT